MDGSEGLKFGEGLEVTEFPRGDAFGEWGAFGGEEASEGEFDLVESGADFGEGDGEMEPVVEMIGIGLAFERGGGDPGLVLEALGVGVMDDGVEVGWGDGEAGFEELPGEEGFFAAAGEAGAEEGIEAVEGVEGEAGDGHIGAAEFGGVGGVEVIGGGSEPGAVGVIHPRAEEMRGERDGTGNGVGGACEDGLGEGIEPEVGEAEVIVGEDEDLAGGVGEGEVEGGGFSLGGLVEVEERGEEVRGESGEERFGGEFGATFDEEELDGEGGGDVDGGEGGEGLWERGLGVGGRDDDGDRVHGWRVSGTRVWRVFRRGTS